MKKTLLIFEFLLLICSGIHAQSLEDYAKSMNSQSPSRWIDGKYKLLGATYESNNYTIKLEINLANYFDTEALNSHFLQSRILFGYFFSSLYQNIHYKNLIDTIIKNKSKLTFFLSMPSSKITSTISYSSVDIIEILGKYSNLSKDQLFLQGHVVATNIGCPSYIEEGLWLSLCSFDSTQITYHFCCDFLEDNKSVIDEAIPLFKQVFLESLLVFPENEKLFHSCINTKRNIVFKLKDPRTNRLLFTITFSNNDLQIILDQTKK